MNIAKFTKDFGHQSKLMPLASSQRGRPATRRDAMTRLMTLLAAALVASAMAGEAGAWCLAIFGHSGAYHPNGGGWVEETATVADSVYVGPRAKICNSPEVSGNVRIDGGNYGAFVYNNARVYGNAFIGEYSYISGNAHVYGNARVLGSAVEGNAKVYGSAVIGKTYPGQFGGQRQCPGLRQCQSDRCPDHRQRQGRLRDMERDHRSDRPHRRLRPERQPATATARQRPVRHARPRQHPVTGHPAMG